MLEIIRLKVSLLFIHISSEYLAGLALYYQIRGVLKKYFRFSDCSLLISKVKNIKTKTKVVTILLFNNSISFTQNEVE